MKKLSFQFNGAVIIFLILGFGLSLLAWIFGSSLWLGSDARWSSTSFLMMFLFATLAHVFLALAVVVGKYAARPYAKISEPPLRRGVTVGLLIIAGLMG